MNTTTDRAGDVIPAVGAPGSIARQAAEIIGYTITHDQIMEASADQEAARNLKRLDAFLSADQIRTIRRLFKGEEKDHYRQLVREYAERVETMPKVYEQDGKGAQAVAYLHYFRGACDIYILERDTTAKQLQAFGFADLGHGAELGYISIEEIIGAGVELDLYFKPATVAELKAAGKIKTY